MNKLIPQTIIEGSVDLKQMLWAVSIHFGRVNLIEH